MNIEPLQFLLPVGLPTEYQYIVQWKMLNNSEIIFGIDKAQSTGIAEAMVSICNAVYRKKEPELTTIFH